jgi:hypothetical protein
LQFSTASSPSYTDLWMLQTTMSEEVEWAKQWWLELYV